MAVHVVLLGASGVPGRNILSSLLKLKDEAQAVPINITVLKRAVHVTSLNNKKFSTTQLDDYTNVAAFAVKLGTLKPDILISALNAEPAPVLDNHVVDAILKYQESLSSKNGKMIFYINGYTLDYLHPSVVSLPDSAKQSIQAKIDFAHRLHDLAGQDKLDYCTVVNAAFLDYTLVKGYLGLNLDKQTATLIDGGTATMTGCSLEFIGDVVALLVEYRGFGSKAEKEQVLNRRIRIAETQYSGQDLVRIVEKITGKKFDIRHEKSDDILRNGGSAVRYLNWVGKGAADFSSDGFQLGKDLLKRKTLEELCSTAIANGLEPFQGAGR